MAKKTDKTISSKQSFYAKYPQFDHKRTHIDYELKWKFPENPSNVYAFLAKRKRNKLGLPTKTRFHTRLRLQCQTQAQT